MRLILLLQVLHRLLALFRCQDASQIGDFGEAWVFWIIGAGGQSHADRSRYQACPQARDFQFSNIKPSTQHELIKSSMHGSPRFANSRISMPSVSSSRIFCRRLFELCNRLFQNVLTTVLFLQLAVGPVLLLQAVVNWDDRLAMVFRCPGPDAAPFFGHGHGYAGLRD